jgi:Cu+-exporting ATPase
MPSSDGAGTGTPLARGDPRTGSRDPVCGADLGPAGAVYTVRDQGVTYQFCSARCKEAFRAAPHRYVRAGLIDRAIGLWRALAAQGHGGGGRCC